MNGDILILMSFEDRLILEAKLKKIKNDDFGLDHFLHLFSKINTHKSTLFFSILAYFFSIFFYFLLPI